MRKPLTALLAAAAAAVAGATAGIGSAATVKKKVTTTTTVAGPQVEADRWGPLQVTLLVKKTTTTVGARKIVVRTIAGVRVPLYPNHTDRSVFINEQALPMLVQEELSAQFGGNVQMISGATATSLAFGQSLQAALLSAKKA
jgi:hypothetical protein